MLRLVRAEGYLLSPCGLNPSLSEHEAASHARQHPRPFDAWQGRRLWRVAGPNRGESRSEEHGPFDVIRDFHFVLLAGPGSSSVPMSGGLSPRTMASPTVSSGATFAVNSPNEFTSDGVLIDDNDAMMPPATSRLDA